jgi:hypothetical protein
VNGAREISIDKLIGLVKRRAESGFNFSMGKSAWCDINAVFVRHAYACRIPGLVRLRPRARSLLVQSPDYGNHTRLQLA